MLFGGFKMAKCDNCGREIDTKECRIKDDMGTRYRNFCDDCIEKLSEEAQIDVLNAQKTAPEKAERIAKPEDIKMTTTPSFEGYRIREYKGVIFDETITGIGLKTAFKSFGDMFASLTGEQMYAVTSRINELKIELINRIKAKAAAQGANAVVGVDFESTMPGGNAIMVSANGTAVIIEKIEQ